MHQVSSNGEKVSITCQQHGYTLMLDSQALGKSHWQVRFELRKGPYQGSVSARDLDDYPPITLPKSCKIIEVGAGLGEMSPSLAQAGHKVTIIDPANYALLTDMLQFSRNHAPGGYLPRIDTLIERCTTILDASKVTLINTTLAEYVKSGARRCADVVIDHYGARFHGGGSYRDLHHAEKIVKKLLNPGGELIGMPYS
jgi:hypothetical protein